MENNQTTKNSLNGTYDSLKGKLEKLSHESMPKLETEFDALSKIGSESYKEAKTIAKDTWSEVSDQASAASRQAIAFVRKNPLLTTAAVLLVGYGVARLLRSSPKAHPHALSQL